MRLFYYNFYFRDIGGHHMWAREGGGPPNRRESQAGGPGGNDIWGPRRRKIGRIWGPTVSRGSGGKEKCSYRQFIREFL